MRTLLDNLVSLFIGWYEDSSVDLGVPGFEPPSQGENRESNSEPIRKEGDPVPGPNDRFRVSVKLTVEKLDPVSGEPQPFASTEQIYESMKYPRLVEIQETIAESLLDKGRAASNAMSG